MLWFIYGEANRSGESGHRKDGLLFTVPQRRSMRGHTGKHPGQPGGRESHGKWAQEPSLLFLQEGTGKTELANVKNFSGVWSTGPAPVCPVPGPGGIRAGRQWLWVCEPCESSTKTGLWVWALGELLHMKAPSQGGLLLSLGIGWSYEGQSFQGQQDPRGQRIRNIWLIRSILQLLLPYPF